MPGSSLPSCSLCVADEMVGAVQHDAGAPHVINSGLLEGTPNEGPLTFLSRLLDTTGFYPRWHCGSWPASVGWLHIGSDIAIFLAYSTIPTALLYFILRRKEVPLRGIFWLFAAFIFSCGITHALDASMFYHPAYRLLGLMKLITAAVSITTAIALIRAMPLALGVPGQLKAQETEIQRRVKAEEEVLLLNRQLQDRNSQLTVRSRRIEQAMEGASVGMLRWNAKSGAIEWQIGVTEALRTRDGAVIRFTQWSDILDTPSLAALLRTSQTCVATGRPMGLEVPISPTVAKGLRIRVSASRERGTPAEDAAIIGFARILDGSVVETRIE